MCLKLTFEFLEGFVLIVDLIVVRVEFVFSFKRDFAIGHLERLKSAKQNHGDVVGVVLVLK